MRLNQKRATIFLCTVALAALSGSAFARPSHHHRHSSANAVRSMAQPQKDVADRDMRYPSNAAATVAAPSALAEVTVGHRRHGRQMSAFERAQSHSNSAFGGLTNDALVSEARKYIGTNPTGRGRLWCGAFMDLVLKRTGHAGGGNLAIGYEHYGTRVSGPQVGAIAVMGRRGGGHVGVVTGIDANGNPIIVSGNHNNTVAESVYPRGRIAAYVVPGG
jgi:uncharacterized protein (TIGR02594 family)